MALFGISGKISSGKDTIGKIIQILVDSPQLTTQGVISFLKGEYNNPSYLIKKFADSLKDIICILTGCTRIQLEDKKFKDTELPESWWYWRMEHDNALFDHNLAYDTPKETLDMYEGLKLIKPTYRLLLQQMGTECGRDIIHPNLWVNALFSQYKAKCIPTGDSIAEEDVSLQKEYPNWIITDVRFPNELQAVKDRYGITIRVEREQNCTEENIEQFNFSLNHPSETALDNASFEYTIENNGTIEELIEKVKEILIKENIIQNEI